MIITVQTNPYIKNKNRSVTVSDQFFLDMLILEREQRPSLFQLINKENTERENLIRKTKIADIEKGFTQYEENNLNKNQK